MTHYSLVIIGSGPAAYTAGLYASRNNIKTCIITGDMPGGQLTTTSEVENFPGFPDGIMGTELVTRMEKQAEKNGTVIINDFVTSVTPSSPGFTLSTQKGKGYTADSVIIATGATAKKLYIPGADRLWMKGISACAVCDGPLPLFKNKHIVVVGGGDSAMEEALFLSKYAGEAGVSIVHRRDTFRASKVLQERVFKHPNIKVIWNSEVILAEGAKKLEQVTIRTSSAAKDKVEEYSLKCGGLFYAIGHTPNTQFLSGLVKTDADGYIITTEGTKTSVPGVFACGDVQDKKYRQAITAAGSGCMAALDAEHYLTTHN